MEKYIDTHTHYFHRLFNKDREGLIKELFKTDIRYIIECGTDTISNKKVIDFINTHKDVYGVIGFFPTNTHELEDPKTMETFLSQLQHKKVVGLGEIGLDYYHKGNPTQQKKWFIKQLNIAKKLNLPVCIHSRNAEKDTVAILKKNGEMKGVIHCYAYGVNTMRELVKLGYYFGVGGTCTYKNNVELRKAIKEMPLDRIVLETDCPYLTPDAVRHERNDSSKIKYVIEEIAKLKHISPEEVVKATNENVRRLYPKIF
jgi:TatD DNase family protein